MRGRWIRGSKIRYNSSAIEKKVWSISKERWVGSSPARRLTLDSLTSPSKTSLNHFLFILPSFHPSSLISNHPSFSSVSDPFLNSTPSTSVPSALTARFPSLSFGGIHLVPANSLKRLIDSGESRGKREMGTRRSFFEESGSAGLEVFRKDVTRR